MVGIVLEGRHAPEEVEVAGGEPAYAQPRQPEGLGHHPEAHRPLVEVRGGRQAVGGVMFEEPVHLVGEQRGARPPGHAHRQAEGLLVGLGPGGVVREVEDDEARRRPDEVPERGRIKRPPLLVTQLQEVHVGPGGAGDLVEGLVGGPHHRRAHPGALARTPAGDHAREGEDGLLGAGEDQHALGRDGLVEGGYLLAQQRVAGRFRVTEGEILPHPAPLAVGQGEQPVQAHRLHVRGTQQVGRVELVTGEVTLQLELRHVPQGALLSCDVELHGGPCRFGARALQLCPLPAGVVRRRPGPRRFCSWHVPSARRARWAHGCRLYLPGSWAG